MDSKYSAINKPSIATTIHNFLLKRKNSNGVSALNGPNAKQQKLQTLTKNDQVPAATLSAPAHTANSSNGSMRSQNNGSIMEQRKQLPVFGVKIP